MKFSMPNARLIEALGAVKPAAARAGEIPLLQCVLICANVSGEVTLTATDMAMRAQVTVEADVGQSGIAAVPAAPLLDIARTQGKDALVTIDLPEGQAVARITIGTFRSRLNCLDAADFPAPLKATGAEVRFTCALADLQTIFEATRFAVSADETRYYLAGCLLHVVSDGEGRHIRSVATDGHRLAWCQFPAPQGLADNEISAILPSRLVTELMRLKGDVEQQAEVTLWDNGIAVRVGDLHVASTLISAQYPEYARVIPQNNANRATIPSGPLARVVQSVAVVGMGRSRPVKVHFDKDAVKVEAEDETCGSAIDEIGRPAGYVLEGGTLSVGFQARYVRDILDHVGESAIFAFAQDSGAPVLITSQGDASRGFVLMPMRI